MIITLKKAVAQTMGVHKFIPFEPYMEKYFDAFGREEYEIDLHGYDAKKLDNIEALFSLHARVRGVGVILKDIKAWRETLAGTRDVSARTVNHFKSILIQHLNRVEGHRVYEKTGEGAWVAYYVEEIKYHPKEVHRDTTTPEHVTVDLMWEEFGGIRAKTITFWDSDCRTLTATEALIRKGLFAETPEYRREYLDTHARFLEVSKQIGTQYWAAGEATDDVDGNQEGRRNSWYWSSKRTYQMERDGQRTRVLVDIYYECDDTDRRQRNYPVDVWFWNRYRDKDPDQDEHTAERPDPEIPVHPQLVVFDLRKHLRLRIHVNFLTRYEYDTQLINKLILPEETKGLVRLLVEHKSGTFRDIVANKAGGAVVMLAGPPGVGKTLTAEIYAEAEQRGLYSIQCSQLGTDPAELEDELLKVFARARRWNAVTLLDEADVYVRERGRDLQQNAIVGVFLRVLEYQDNVLFLTTNRPDDVDDAVLSRCVARLTYQLPPREDQRRIWRTLADTTGALLNDEEIDRIVTQHPSFSGRDIKNTLKLAMLVCPGRPITAEAVTHVNRFRPTGKTE